MDLILLKEKNLITNLVEFDYSHVFKYVYIYY